MGNSSSSGSLEGDIKMAIQGKDSKSVYLPPELHNIINEYTSGECEYVPEIEKRCDEFYYNPTNKKPSYEMPSPFGGGSGISGKAKTINCKSHCLRLLRQNVNTVLSIYKNYDFESKNPDAILKSVDLRYLMYWIQMHVDTEGDTRVDIAGKNAKDYDNIRFDGADRVLRAFGGTGYQKSITWFYKMPAEFDYSKITKGMRIIDGLLAVRQVF